VVTDQDRSWVASMPRVYDELLGPAVFRPFAVDLAARAGRLGSRSVLELAAGTGIATRELLAALPSATVTATDLNAAMVAWGREHLPAATWQVADAQQLPFPDATFDLVACQFGVMFFPDRPAAYAECRRVLAPGGRLLVNSWDTLDTHGFETPLVAVLRTLFPQDPPEFLATVPHGYCDPDAIRADLVGGGFDTITIDRVTVEGHIGSAADIAVGYCTGTPLRAQIAARGDVAETAAATAAELTRRLGPDPISAPMSAFVVSAAGAPGRGRG
jgi:SAM-dependent methyltransferase